MDEVELECAVYGEGTVFPVKIARDAKVSALQKAIVNEKKDVNHRFNVDPATLTLYLARKDGVWLKHDENVKSFLHGKIDTQYKEMLSSWTLDDKKYFKKRFQPGHKEIHILVELPNAHYADPKLLEIQELLLRHVLLDAPSSTSGRSNQFKAVLSARYNCDMGSGKLRCMLLNTALPSRLIIASHLFRRSNGYLCEKLMGFSDIDDERNGLLLFKPLEDAFDHFQISFIYDQSSNEFRLKIWDQSVRSERLFAKLNQSQCAILLQNQTLPINWESQGQLLAPGTDYDIQTTFGDLEGHAICFQSVERPYKRCLNVQARLARKKAIENKWIKPEEDEFQDFWSEGMSLAEKMEFFYVNAT